MRTSVIALSCAVLLLLMPALVAAQDRPAPTGGGTTVGTAETRGGGSSGGSTGGSSGSSGGSIPSASGSPMASSPANMGSGRYDGPRSGDSTPNLGPGLRAMGAALRGGRDSGPNAGQPVPASERPRGDRPTYGYAVSRTEYAASHPPSAGPGGGGYPSGNYDSWYDSYYGSYGPYYPYTMWYPPYTLPGMRMLGYPYWLFDPWMSWAGLGPLYGYGMYSLPLSRYGSYWYDYYANAAGASYVESTQGSIKLKVKPKNAEVYVDGTFYGTVDHYDGAFQHLALRAGAHKFEIRLNGYETITFQARVLPGRSITYSGEMKAIK